MTNTFRGSCPEIPPNTRWSKENAQIETDFVMSQPQTCYTIHMHVAVVVIGGPGSTPAENRP